MADRCFNFKDGMNEYSEGTHDCGPQYAGCCYQYNGRCCFKVATIRQEVSRACHEEIVQSNYDAEADLYEG